MIIIKLLIMLTVEGILFASGLCLRKSRIVYNMIFFYSWLLLAFTMDSFDIGNYRISYGGVSNELKEAAFYGLTDFLSSHGVPFELFKIAWGTIICVILYLGLKRYTSQTAVLAAMFMVFPLWGFATQMRSSMAGAIVIFAVPCLFRKRISHYMLYILLILLACQFHIMSVFYFLLLLPLVFDFDPEKYKSFGLLVSAIGLIVFSLKASGIEAGIRFLLSILDVGFLSGLFLRFIVYFNESVRSTLKGVIYFSTHHYLVYLLTDLHLKAAGRRSEILPMRFNNLDISSLRNLNTTMLLMIPFYALTGQFMRFFYYSLPMCYAFILDRNTNRSRNTPTLSLSLSEALLILCTAFVFLFGLVGLPEEIVRFVNGFGRL